MNEFEPCASCRRTPLIGETVTVLGGREHELALCDLCPTRPRAGTLGEPLRRERVRSVAGSENVTRLAPAPLAPASRRTAPEPAISLDVAANSSIAV